MVTTEEADKHGDQPGTRLGPSAEDIAEAAAGLRRLIGLVTEYLVSGGASK